MIMERYTIYCGLAVGGDNRKKIIANSRLLALQIADQNLGDYTVQQAEGRWNGEKEETLIFTFITDLKTDITKVNAFAHAYKFQNNQESVLIVEEEVKARFYGKN